MHDSTCVRISPDLALEFCIAIQDLIDSKRRIKESNSWVKSQFGVHWQMTDTGKSNRWSFVGLASKAFVLASVVAVVLPAPRYAGSLGSAEYMVWVMRLSWVLLLTVGFVGVSLLAGFVNGWLQKNTRKRE
ncbi:MAG: hypothetical protein HY788_19450 [Deltaproteobacteria bacterium]|nr:hypothetical protein [Deltaproteobacteria bacterium]